MSLEHLCFVYGKDNVLRWCRSLTIFRLCAPHPYPDDLHPDRFLACIKYSSEVELQTILSQLNLAPDLKIRENARFQQYTESSWSGWQLINGEPCLFDVNKILQTITLTVSGTLEDPYALDETVFERAKRIEDFLKTKNLTFKTPPQNDRYCISPAFYPELWKNEKS